MQKAIHNGSEDKHAFFNLGVALMNCSESEDAMAYMKQSQIKKEADGTWEAYFDPMAH